MGGDISPMSPFPMGIYHLLKSLEILTGGTFTHVPPLGTRLLTKAGILRLDTRREQITKLTFEQMKDETISYTTFCPTDWMQHIEILGTNTHLQQDSLRWALKRKLSVSFSQIKIQNKFPPKKNPPPQNFFKNPQKNSKFTPPQKKFQKKFPS